MVRKGKTLIRIMYFTALAAWSRSNRWRRKSLMLCDRSSIARPDRCVREGIRETDAWNSTLELSALLGNC